jgi:hypothetical protein
MKPRAGPRFVAVAGLVLALAAALPAAAQEAARPPIVIVFSHGTVRPQVPHRCSAERDVPPVFAALAAQPGWRIDYLCSLATDGDEPASYTYKRAREIEARVATHRAAGVPARRIFLAGWSAGAWSSLLVARRGVAEFNAVVALAPAFAGPRSEIPVYPRWWNEHRPRQIADLAAAPRIDALVFAHDDDAFDRPEDLRFLAAIPGVSLIDLSDCRAGHGTAYSACFGERAGDTIRRYIRRRAGLGE